MAGRNSNLTLDEKKMIRELKTLNKSARKAPWGFGEIRKQDARGVYTIYKVRPAEEELIVKMRNSIDELLAIIERKTK